MLLNGIQKYCTLLAILEYFWILYIDTVVTKFGHPIYWVMLAKSKLQDSYEETKYIELNTLFKYTFDNINCSLQASACTGFPRYYR